MFTYFSFDFKSIFIPFWPHFDSILASFWSQFWSTFTSLGGSGGGGAKRRRNSLTLGSLWAPRGLHFSSKINLFFNQKMHYFFDRFLMLFWLHFGFILGSILHQKTSLGWKRRFCQNERLVYTRALFSRVGTPKIHPKSVPWVRLESAEASGLRACRYGIAVLCI